MKYPDVTAGQVEACINKLGGWEGFNAFLRDELAVMRQSHLRLISGGHDLMLPATNGTRTIAQAADLFTGWLDANFHSWGLDVPTAPTVVSPVEVHELAKDGTFAQIYAGTGRDLDGLCFTQDQIIGFVEQFPDWLRADGYATFFLFRKGQEFFVARVSRHGDGRLDADVDRLAYGGVWHVEYRGRFVIPQHVAQVTST